MKYLRSIKSPALVLALSGALLGGAQAGETVSAKGGPAIIEEEPSMFDKIWAVPTLYKNPDNFWLQELKIVGRYHGQYAVNDRGDGTGYIWENRRQRIGASAKFADIFKLYGQIDISNRWNPFYRNIDVAYLEIAPSDAFKIQLGKVKPKWSEYAISSKYIKAFERANLVNQVRAFKSSGANIAGDLGKWSYYASLTSDELDTEFASLDAGYYVIGSLGYDLAENLPFEKAAARLDYLYHSEETEFREPYKHSFSLNFSAEDGPLGLYTDLIYANGYENDAWGLIIMPTYDITEQLEFVFRYHYAKGENDSMRAAGRYERRLGELTDGGFGENYNSFYAGLNYFIYGQKLKLMTGIEYATLDDPAGDGGSYNGWTWLAGVRMFF